MTACELIDLLEQVDGTFIEEAAAPFQRAGRKPRVWLIAAAVISALAVTAAAASYYLNLTGYLQKNGMQDVSGAQMLQVDIMESFSTELADFKVLEAVRDRDMIYVVTEIKPSRENDLLIPEFVIPSHSVQELNIEGVTEGTIEQYAEQQGKRLVVAGAGLMNFDSTTIDAHCTADGSMYVYISTSFGENRDHLEVQGFTEDPKTREIEHVSREVPLQDQSSAKEMVFETFDPKLGPEVHVTPIRLTFRETELGLQVSFTYQGDPERASNIHFCSVVDSEGKELSHMPGAVGKVKDNQDGTYTSVAYYQNVGTYEGLSLKFAHHGPYTFGK